MPDRPAPLALPNAMPKVELHLHLDCSLSFACVNRLDPEVDLAAYRSEFVIEGKCPSLVAYLERTLRMVGLMQTPAALRLVVDDLFDQLVRDGVLYAEIRFAPFLHTERGMSPDEVLTVVDEAVVAASAATGVEARLIVCTLRHFDAARSMETAELAVAHRGRGTVVGLDIAGDEAGFGLDAHVDAFTRAREGGLMLTAHAGESVGPESVVETLDRIGPERIGHGVRSIEDEAVVRRLVAEGVHLEICPTSNVQTMAELVPTYADHPVDALRRAGVPLSISTDTRGVSGVTLSMEYERLRQAFGWGDAELRACNRAGLDAAFAPEHVKARMASSLERFSMTGGSAVR